MFASWQESYNKSRQCVEKQRHYSADKCPDSQGYGLPSGHVRLWELDHKGGRTPKNWYFRIVVLEKSPTGPLDTKEIKPVNLKEDKPWIFTKLPDAEAEVPVFWSPDVNRWLTGKISDAGKNWGQKENRVSEDEMAGWHHQCNGHEPGQTPGDGEGQGGLAWCSLWGRRPQRVRYDLVTERQQQKRSGLEKSMRESWRSLGVYSHRSGRDHMRQCEE